MYTDTDAKDWKNYLADKSLDQVGHDFMSDDEEHPHCGTPECCGQCETSEKKS